MADEATPRNPVFEHGFWWWFDPRRGGWFVGTAPQIQKPTWAAGERSGRTWTSGVEGA